MKNLKFTVNIPLLSTKNSYIKNIQEVESELRNFCKVIRKQKSVYGHFFIGEIQIFEATETVEKFARLITNRMDIQHVSIKENNTVYSKDYSFKDNVFFDFSN